MATIFFIILFVAIISVHIFHHYQVKQRTCSYQNPRQNYSELSLAVEPKKNDSGNYNTKYDQVFIQDTPLIWLKNKKLY
jgi:hypothetical protein